MPTGAPVSKNPTTTSPLMRIVLHSSKWARNMWLVTKRRRGGGCRTEGFRVTGTTYSVTQLDRIEKNRQKLSKIWEIDRSYSCLQQFDKFWIWIACNGNYVNLLKNICKSIQANLFSADFSHSKPLSVKRGVESENSGKETLRESGQKFVGNW